MCLFSRRERQIPNRRWKAFRDGIVDCAYLIFQRQAARTAQERMDPDTTAKEEGYLNTFVASVASKPDATSRYWNEPGRAPRVIWHRHDDRDARCISCEAG